VLTYFLLPSRPAEAKFLNKEEKDWIEAGLATEEREKLASHKISAVQALMNRRIWHLGLIGFTLNTGMYTMNFWMPKLVKSLSSGYSNSLIGVLVMIPHLVGLPVMVLVSRSSDRRRERRFHAAIPAITAGIALASLGATHSIFGTVVLLSFAALGIYSVCGGLRDCSREFACESWGICGTVRDRLDQPENGQLVRRPGGCGHFAVCVGDADVAASEKAARERE